MQDDGACIFIVMAIQESLQHMVLYMFQCYDTTYQLWSVILWEGLMRCKGARPFLYNFLDSNKLKRLLADVKMSHFIMPGINAAGEQDCVVCVGCPAPGQKVHNWLPSGYLLPVEFTISLFR